MLSRVAIRRLITTPSSRAIAIASTRPLVRIPTTTTHTSSFHTTSPVWAKKSKSKKLKEKALHEEEAEGTEEITIDFDTVTGKFDHILEKFSKAATEIKLGKANPQIFDSLVVGTPDGELPFTSIAQTSIKGRHFIITLFNPDYGKHVINAILGSELNMSGQVDPTNKFAIKVPLPSLTTESKKENAKHLKEVLERYKNGKLDSLAAVRAHFRHKFTKHLKKQKLSDSENKMLKELEDMHKKYADKLHDVFKSAETAILK